MIIRISGSLVVNISGSLVIGPDPTPVATGFPEGNRVALWRAMDYTINGGAITVPNAWATETDDGNILKNSGHIGGSSAAQFVNWFSSSATLTADRTGPDGFASATRVVSTAANGQLISTGQAVPAGTFTLVVWIKSNSGAQTVKIGQSSTLTDCSVTTSWQQFAGVFTLGGVAGGITVARDDGSNTLDVDVLLQGMYAGDVSAAVPELTPLHGALKGGLSESPTRSGNVLSFSSNAHMMAQWDEAIDLSTGALTHFWIFRCAADSVGVAGLVGVRENNSIHTFGRRGLGRLQAQSGFTQTRHQQGVRTDGQGWQVLTCVADTDASELRFYVGRQLVQVLTGVTPNTSTTHKDWAVGFSSGSSAGDILGGGMYNRALSEAEIPALVTACEAIITESGETVGTVMPFLLLEGDSITSDGAGSSDYYGNKMAFDTTPSLATRWLMANVATPGAGTSQISGRTALRARYLTDTANRTCVMSVWWTNLPMDNVGGGAEYLTDLQSIVTTANGQGWNYVVSATQTPKTQAGYNTERATVTAGIGALTGIEAIVGFASDSRFGDDADASNPALYPDGSHPSATVQGYMGELYAAAINGLVL